MFGDTLRLRIGVNTGDVVVGEPRVGSSFVTGDAVNVAARLEQGANPGEILVGERTVAAARTDFRVRPGHDDRGQGEGGRGNLSPAARSRALGPRGSDPLGTFVGREPELEAFGRPTACTRDDNGRFSSRSWGSRGSARARSCASSAAGSATRSPCAGRTHRPLPFVRAGKRVLAARRGRRAAIRTSPSGGPSWESHSASRRRPSLHPLVVVQRLRGAWVERLKSSPQRGPLVVLIEDLHWAEPELLELLGATGRFGARCCVLGTARDAIELPAETITLEALPPRMRSRIVDGLAPETLAAGPARVRCRALGRQSALRRGDHADAGRPGRDGCDPAGPRRPRHRPGAACGAHRPAPAGREVRSAGRRCNRSDFRRRGRARAVSRRSRDSRRWRSAALCGAAGPSSRSCTLSPARSRTAA